MGVVTRFRYYARIHWIKKKELFFLVVIYLINQKIIIHFLEKGKNSEPL